MQKTEIEYLTHTWNPIAMRCTPISSGCKNCWHLTVADRLAKNPKISIVKRRVYAGKSPPFLNKRELEAPLKKKKPSIIGVQFMGDIALSKISYDDFEKIMFIIADAFWHTFVVLTKRPRRLKLFIETFYDKWLPTGFYVPLKNLYIGVSVEDQTSLDQRTLALLEISAAVRFISAEPLLSEIDLKLRGYAQSGNMHSTRRVFLNWIIAGTESGSKRRPAKTEWIRSLRDQCKKAGLPFFLKQREINGKVAKMPTIDGKVWDQYPK